MAKTSSVASGKQLLPGRTDVIQREVIVRGNLSSLGLGNGWQAQYLPGKSANSRIIRKLQFFYTLQNKSSSSSDYFAWISLWHLLTRCTITVNQSSVPIFEMQNGTLPLGRLYQQRLSELAQNLEEYQALIDADMPLCNTDVRTATTIASLLSFNVVGATSTTECFNSLGYFVPLFKDYPLDARTRSIDFDFQIGNTGDLPERMAYVDTHGTTTGIVNQFALNGLFLKVTYDEYYNAMSIPPVISMISARYLHKEYLGCFGTNTSLTINLQTEFPQVRRLRRVFYVLIDNAAWTNSPEKNFQLTNLITGLTFNINGRQELTYLSRASIQRNMIQQFWDEFSHPPVLYSSTDTVRSGVLFMEYVNMHYPEPLGEAAHEFNHILSGRDTKEKVYELVFNTAATNTYSLHVILHSDLFANVSADGNTSLTE
jgi:hypothetical protein